MLPWAVCGATRERPMAASNDLGVRRTLDANGIRLSVSVAGEGPLVILMHGWPEQSLSWRHQVPALVQAGWRVAVPDMRGYGESDKPSAPEAYTLNTIADDMGGVAAALGAQRWVSVGHDWGAMAAWRCALKHPDQVAAVFGMSVPHTAPSSRPFADIVEALYPDRFFYIRYFQEPGMAEAELSHANLHQALKQIFYGGSGEGVRSASRNRHAPRNAKLLEAWSDAPEGPLSFMSDAELDAYADAFRRGGWQGPLNWYRNFERQRRRCPRPGRQHRPPAGRLPRGRVRARPRHVAEPTGKHARPLRRSALRNPSGRRRTLDPAGAASRNQHGVAPIPGKRQRAPMSLAVRVAPFRPPYAPDDTTLARSLLDAAPLSPEREARVDTEARALIGAIRGRAGGIGGIEALLREYSLTTPEGLALMVLAEGLLRVPDDATADRLIEDKLGQGDLAEAGITVDTLLVNASAWALGLSARLIGPQDTPEGILRGVVRRLGLPTVRGALRQAMR